MSFRPRVIPVLLLQNQGLVKTEKFKKPTYIGDPINAVQIFNDLQADEIVFLDIDASKNQALIDINFVREVGEEANMPFTVGGGIRSIEAIRDIILAGAERVIIGNYALENPDFIKEAALAFGSSTIAVCIDVKKNLFGKQKVYSLNGKKSWNYSPIDFAQLMEQKGAGELIVQSIDNDGSMTGYDLDLIHTIASAVTIPVIALGGAGEINHLKKAFHEAYASGVAAGSLFVFQNKSKGVLINYPQNLKELL
jgi:cyclase